MARHWIARAPGDLDVLTLVDDELPDPGPGEVRIVVTAAGMNPADYKHVAGGDAGQFPKAVGYEVAGVVGAIGADTELASGGGAVGDAVLAFRISGGWADEVVVPARDVFAKPASLGDAEAANLLLVGTTAAEMLHRTGVAAGETILVHGASGAVGVSVLQQAARVGARVIGTASVARFPEVRRFAGVPVAYGSGLAQRVRELCDDAGLGPVVAALDCVGTDEAIEVSLDLVDRRERIITIANPARAESEEITWIQGAQPESARFRDGIRAELIGLAGAGELVVPVARTFALTEALDAARFLQGQHPGGKLALVP